jgi:hypothetical protein
MLKNKLSTIIDSRFSIVGAAHSNSLQKFTAGRDLVECDYLNPVRKRNRKWHYAK